jgi:hypothetical protein
VVSGSSGGLLLQKRSLVAVHGLHASLLVTALLGAGLVLSFCFDFFFFFSIVCMFDAYMLLDYLLAYALDLPSIIC